MSASCRSCSKPVIWVVTKEKGASMPLDPDPVDNGNIRLTGRTRRTSQGGQAPEAEYVKQEAMTLGLDDDESRYVSHFATCPNAKAHRRG